jgi:tetratricopeptide (TPR) repeat protein
MSRLDKNRWQALSPYLDDAIDMTAEERARLLASLRQTHPVIAGDLEALLNDRDAIDRERFLEDSPPQPASLALQGLRVGAYRLHTAIGEGGMGSVWLAERADGRFEGRAAVKLLNAGLIGRAGEERFAREARILAQLTDPGIAHLVDAGVSTLGQPYLILEYVEGEHIDEYCASRKLNVEARIRLFLQVLDAVAHAHANLIVHRDLKPANVLVRADGRVKLLDFGIAKLLEPQQAAGQEQLTVEGARLLTPAFAAPEQMTGGQITTATDVYALGVLLYVLLAGRHPGGQSTRSPVELMNAIVHTEPQRPSDVVESPAVRRALRGDLDTILAKALKKEPAKRYHSVEAFADDLRRYLRREPISARPDTWRYRGAKFVRRHAVGVAAAALVVATIVALVGFYTARLAAERDRARLEAGKSAAASDLLTELLTGADPYNAAGGRKEPTVRELLDAGTERIDRELANQPELKAEMLTVLGRTYHRLNVTDKAVALLERALALGREVDPGHARVAQALNDLGAVLLETGETKRARPLLEEALAMRRRLVGPEGEQTAVTLVELGRAYGDEGDLHRAEPLLREALAIRRKLFGDVHAETATSVNELGLLLFRKGDITGAEPLIRENVAIARAILGERHPDLPTALNNLSLVLLEKRDLAEAESVLRESLAIRRATQGDEAPDLAPALNNLTHVLRQQGKFAEAIAAGEEAVKITTTTRGQNHPSMATMLATLARAHLESGDAASAEPLARRALQIRRAGFPETDLRLAAMKSLLGGTLTGLGRYQEAEALLLEAQKTLTGSSPFERREAALITERLAELRRNR